MITYKVFTEDEAKEAGLRHPWGEEWGDSWEPCRWLFMSIETDEVSDVKFVATDGGEPEDQTFDRDWSWVEGELNNAYQAGYDQGCKDNY